MDPVIQNIAKRANVSPSTAYRILSGKTKGLRQDAAHRAEIVKHAAEELGYKPSPAARGLALQRSLCIGFIGAEMENPVRSQLVEKLRAMIFEKGFNLLVSGCNYDDNLVRTINNMQTHRVDGLILAHGHEFPEKRLLELVKSGIPIVSFGQDSNLQWDNVVIDYSQMIYDLTTHLIRKHGLENIAFAGLSKPYPRYSGFIAAMKEHGVLGKAEKWITDRYTMEDGRLLALKMIQGGSRPQAIVCHNDMLAIGIISGLREFGFSVPRDIAVVGLDNIDIASYFNPKLTSIGIDSSKLADTLFALLFDRLDDNKIESPVERVCQAKLTIRESCGCKD